MPLLDLFRHPTQALVVWSSFHTSWVTMMTRWLNRTLPPRYRARSNVTFGRGIAADVAEYDVGGPEADEPIGSGGSNGPIATAPATWAPPMATATVPIVFADDLEVRIFDTRENAALVAAIELVSPANKDREESRRGFAAKCAAYLERGIGLLVIDTVTSRNGDLFAAILRMVGQPVTSVTTEPPELHAVSFRPVQRQDRSELDLWLRPLTVGQELPTLPLWLRGDGAYRVDLEATYTEAREVEGY